MKRPESLGQSTAWNSVEHTDQQQPSSGDPNVDNFDSEPYFHALPHAPPFPLYGLDKKFTGSRGIELWDAKDGELWHVDLAHGGRHLSAAPALIVITHSRTETAGIEDAALGALLYLHHAQGEVRDHRDPAAVSLLVQLSAQWNTAPWSSAIGTVKGSPMVFQRYRRGELWAAVVDLGAVALGIVGNGIELADYGYEPVNDSLWQYDVNY